MPIRKKKIVEKVVAFEGEQDFIVNANKPEYISAGEVLYVDADGRELIGGGTNVSGGSTTQLQTDFIEQNPASVGGTSSGIPSGATTNGSTTTATTTTPPNCINCCILNTSGTTITIGSLEAFLGKKLACSQVFSPVSSGQKGSILLTPEEVSILNPSANWEIFTSPCEPAQNVTPCDASIDQFNITTSGTTANVGITIKQGTKPVKGIVYILDGGSENLTTQPNFTLNNLSVGNHSLIALIECTDGSRIGKQTKSFTISATPTPPTTTVTSTTTFVPPYTFGGGFGGGGGATEKEIVKKDKFPWLLVLLIAGGLFLLTRKRKKEAQ